MCLDMGLHFFVTIGENFPGAQIQANCTDKAQHRDFGSIRGDFDLWQTSARRSGSLDHTTNPIGIPTIHRETQQYGKDSINRVVFQNTCDGRGKLSYPVHGCG